MDRLAPLDMAKRIVGISEMATSASRDEVIVTHSLGTCLGVAMYDSGAGLGGMIHCMLPLSRLDPERAGASPAMFVDTGVPALLQALYDLGARRRRLVVTVAGAAAAHDDQGLFRIGERNLTVLRKILWKNDILIAAEEVGGAIPRTMYLRMNDGRTIIAGGGGEHYLMAG